MLAEPWADSSAGVALRRVEVVLCSCSEDFIKNALEASALVLEFNIWTAGNLTEGLLTGMCGAVPGLYAWVLCVAWNCRFGLVFRCFLLVLMVLSLAVSSAQFLSSLRLCCVRSCVGANLSSQVSVRVMLLTAPMWSVILAS